MVIGKNSGADLVKLQVADPKSDYDSNTRSYQIFKSTSFSKEEIFNIYKFVHKKIKIFLLLAKKFWFFKNLINVVLKYLQVYLMIFFSSKIFLNLANQYFFLLEFLI